MNMKSQHSFISCSDLLEDLLPLVSIRLHFCDHLSFRGVCATWRRAALKKKFNQCSPFLLRDLDVDNNCHSFICPIDGKCYKLNLPGVYKKYRCRNSSHGWLFMIDQNSEETLLLNPFTGAQFFLPRNRYAVHQVVLSSAPTAPTEPNCTVFIFQFGHWGFEFCRVGDDEWKEEYFSPAVRIMNATVFKEKLYLLCYPEYSLSDTEATIAAANTATQFELEFVKQPRFPDTKSAHLVESGEELLLVIRRCSLRIPNDNICFEVFKRDMRTSSWVQMKKIGNRVLFLGDKYFGNYSASFIATELGCKENQIYFQYRKGNRYIWCIFNMEDSSVNSASWDPFLEREKSFGLIGITPSFV